MPHQETKAETEHTPKPVEQWLPALVPPLKKLWPTITEAFPYPPPNLADWLALLHTATTAPARISYYLSQLLHHPENRTEVERSWLILTRLFELTIDIAKNQAPPFEGDIWQNLLIVQNRVFQAAANDPTLKQNQVQQHLREQILQVETNLALGGGFEVDTILTLIGESLVRALEVGACVISQIDPDHQTVTTVAHYLQPEPDQPASVWRKLNHPLPLADDSISQQMVKTKRAIIARATANRPAVWQQSEASANDGRGWGTLLALPFDFPEKTLGLLELYDPDPARDFSATEIELCQKLISRTSLALERSTLFEETRQRLSEVSTLYTMSQKIAGNLNFQEVMESVVVNLRQVIGCRGCCVFLLDANKEQLEIKAAAGLKSEWVQSAKLRIGEGTAGRSVAQGKTIYIPDTSQDPNFIVFDTDVRSLMVTPLWANGEIIGAINVDDDKIDAFGPSQEQLLTIAATQVGVAIENARLFAKVSSERQQNQAIIQYMADGLLVIDKAGTIITCNPALSMMLNLPLSEIIGQSVYSPNLHPHLASLTASATRQARTGVLAKEVTIETPAPKTLQLFSTTMIDANRERSGEVRVVHDITKERNLEQLKSDFMSTISHELRTPLFSIQGFVQILLEDEPEVDPQTRKEFLTTIHTQAVQLSELVNNLLDLAKFDEGKLDLIHSQVNLLRLLRQACRKLLGFAHQQKVELLPQLPESLPDIIGDTERLEQVLTNLIGNAIKFSKAGGQVVVTAMVTNSEILVEVKDNGVGIPAEALEHIFARYYQVNDRNRKGARGSGLGLHIAKKIVEGHQGRIWAESISGQGSTFRFSLPLPHLKTDNS